LVLVASVYRCKWIGVPGSGVWIEESGWSSFMDKAVNGLLAAKWRWINDTTLIDMD
jgi:hypothetical protein